MFQILLMLLLLLLLCVVSRDVSVGSVSERDGGRGVGERVIGG